MSSANGDVPVPTEHWALRFSGVDRGREVMGMPWANRDGLCEAIPPAYTRFVGEQLMFEVAQRNREMAA